MNKRILILICICLTTIVNAQINEIGFFIGGTNYVGDVGSTNFLNPNRVGGGLIYKWNWNSRVALRGTLSYLPIAAKDADSDNFARKTRNHHFFNSIKELAVGVEYSFFDYESGSLHNYFTPYILAEVAAFNYDRVQSKKGANGFNYTDKTSYSMPLGLGMKGRLIENIAWAFEIKASYTFIDDLDYTTKDYPELNFGGSSNDWYMFTGFSLVYTFGRPSCYIDEL